MPPRFYLRCLGVPELRAPGGEPIRFRTRKHMALLAFLAVEPRQPHRRERLADLLWPDASPAEGRHSLATALSVLRGKLGPRTFESTRETVRFVAPDLEVDLDRLARGDVLGNDLTPPLEMGGFLDDFEVSRAPEFVLWRELRRAHWFPAIRRAFIVLMDECRRTGDFSRIETLADRLLVLDELCEDAIRAKMEGRAFAGDRMSALRIFQQWRQKLEEELGATPSAVLEDMASRLRQRGVDPAGGARLPAVLTAQWRDRAFIGRGPQYRACYDHWEESRESRGRHLLLLGESGVGKTTLVERLITAAELEGAVSSRVQCYEVEREIPYAAIGTLVRGMLDRPGASGTAPEWLAELARAVPAVAQRFANLPPPRDTEGEAARLRLTEAVHQLATAIAEEHPLILVVDDVHLSDDASVAVLHLLMRRTQEQRIMIVLTGREPELARSPNASRLQEVRQALALRPVEVPPLTEEEMGEVIAALAEAAHTPLTPPVRRALVRAASGIPMIGELLFDDWQAHGDQCLALGIGAMTVDADSVSGQELFHELADRVMRGLGETARAVLNLAAILGDRLNDLTMYDLVGLKLGQTLAGMAELTGQKVLRDNGRGLEFRNEVLRGYAYLSVPSPHRRALHSLIADRLITAEREGACVPGLSLAWHLYRANRTSDAECYLLTGAREALDRGGCFETELAIQSATQRLSPQYVHAANLLLCESLQDQGRWVESLTLLHQEPGGKDTATAALLLRARLNIARRDDDLRALVQPTIELLKSNAPISMKAPAFDAAAGIAWFVQGDSAIPEVLGSIEESATDPATRASIASAILISTWRRAGPQGLSQLRSMAENVSRECAEAKLTNSSRFHLEKSRGCLEASTGSYDMALKHTQAAYDIALQLGDDERISRSAGNVAVCLGRLGRYSEQELWARRALKRSGKILESWRDERIRFVLANSLAMQGHNDKALQEPLPSLGTLEGAPTWMVQADGLLRADLMQLCGRKEAAIKQARRTFDETGRNALSLPFSGTVARWLALTCIDEQDELTTERNLLEIYAEIDRLDMIDQAETCAALMLYLRGRGRDSKPLSLRLRDALDRLPPAVAGQFSRLGIAPHSD